MDRQGVSVGALARRCGMTHSALYCISTGRVEPRLGVLLAILGALGRDLVWLHEGGVRPEPRTPEVPWAELAEPQTWRAPRP